MAKTSFAGLTSMLVIGGVLFVLAGAWTLTQSRSGALIPPSLMTIGLALLIVGMVGAVK